MKQNYGDDGTAVSRLKELIEQEPLLETGPSLKGINPAIVADQSGSIYFGTGLCTPTKISAGLPFDILSMTLCAEKIRRVLGFTEIYHHIADTHALSNQRFASDSIAKLAERMRDTVELVAKNLGLEHYKAMLASEFDTTPRYESILADIQTQEHEYVRRELADVEWYRQEKNLRLKVGWIIQAKETKLKFDERLFDREYLKVVNGEMCFVYVKAGRTFDKSRAKASPYIYLEDEKRIILSADENVRSKIRDANPSQKVLSHLGKIVRLYEEVVGPVEGSELEDKIQNIICTVFA